MRHDDVFVYFAQIEFNYGIYNPFCLPLMKFNFTTSWFFATKIHVTKIWLLSLKSSLEPYPRGLTYTYEKNPKHSTVAPGTKPNGHRKAVTEAHSTSFRFQLPSSVGFFISAASLLSMSPRFISSSTPSLPSILLFLGHLTIIVIIITAP